jgi:hypothetical protein
MEPSRGTIDGDPWMNMHVDHPWKNAWKDPWMNHLHRSTLAVNHPQHGGNASIRGVNDG